MAGRPWRYRGVIALGAIGLLLYGTAVLALEPIRAHNIAWGLVFVAPLYGVGVLAYVRRPDLPIARLLLLGGSTWAAFSGIIHLAHGRFENGDAEGLGWLALAALLLGGVAVATAVTFFGLYPDGRPQRPYERWAARGVWVGIAVAATAELLGSDRLTVDVEYAAIELPNPIRVDGLSGLDRVSSTGSTVLGSLLPILLVQMGLRYRRSGPHQRQQIRWLLLVPICALALAASGLLLDWAGADWAWFAADTIGQYLYLGLIPAVLVVSILRHRLLDVDVIIRKSFVYGALWVLIALAYVGTAAGIGLAGSQRLPVAAAIVLTVLATILILPLRRGLERVADRVVFGRRLQGYALLEHVGGQLEMAGDQSELMGRLAEAIRSGLRLHWARVVIDGGVADTVGEPGPGESPAHVVPLVHAGEPVGSIECGPKVDGAGFGAEDQHVLSTLGRQAALAVHNTRLASRIVATADAERRRIERDLHDGAQQQVVALLAKLRLARNQLRRGPERAESTLTELEGEVAALHRDLIELTRGIHPPVLSDRGLVEAIRSRSEGLPLPVDVAISGCLDGQRFADEIEGAAYFVCSEALTNVMKHAEATRAVVRLNSTEGRLELRIHDDGAGFNGSSARRGRGLANMADRLTALDGRLSIDSAPGGGTTVCAILPARPRDPMKRSSTDA